MTYQQVIPELKYWKKLAAILLNAGEDEGSC